MAGQVAANNGNSTTYTPSYTNASSTDVTAAGNYLILFEDVNSYLENINLTGAGGGAGAGGATTNGTSGLWSTLNCTNINLTAINSTLCWTLNRTEDLSAVGAFDVNLIEYNYWALILVLFPIFTLFGNILVILSVYRERTLQTATNYFIVSLAFADLLVAGLVMPFAVYVLVNGTWALPSVVCDFYIAMDVTCSTSSIFNLVAISIDRYIAVTQPMKYARHKNNRRVWLTIALVWVISMAIGSPIVLGLNNTPDRVADACLFYNSDFIIYSSLSSFYIPCIIMVFLYYNIFKELRNRAKKSKAVRRPQTYEIKPGTVIENVASTRRLAETQLGGVGGVIGVVGLGGADGSSNQLVGAVGGGAVNTTPMIPIDEQATNTGSGSADEDDDIVVLQDNNVDVDVDDVDDCHIISNDKSTEFILATVVEEAASISSVVATLASPAPLAQDPNGNNDSGYAPSQPEIPCDIHSPSAKRIVRSLSKRSNGATATDTELKPIRTISDQTTERERSSNGSKKERKATAAARFTIYKVNKASKKKREKSSAKKERKATKTLAIVLGVFLICWVPFFTCNIMDAMCSKLGMDCQPGFAAFLLTTWLGYMNSFVNPVIYTIFNPEFRKAFKKLMHIGV